MFELTRRRRRRTGCSFGSQRPGRGSGVRRGWGRTSGRWTIVVGCVGGCIARPTASYSGRRGGGRRGCGSGGAQSFCFHERVVIVVAVITIVIIVMIGCIGGAVHGDCDTVVPRNSSAATLSPRLGWRQSDGSRSCRSLLVMKIGCSRHSLRIALTFPWKNQNTDWTSNNTSFMMYTTWTGTAIAQWVQWLETLKKTSIPRTSEKVSLSAKITTGYGKHPASYSTGIGDFSLRVKRPARKASHSPPSSTGLEMSGAVPLTSHTPWRCSTQRQFHIQLMVWTWRTNRDKNGILLAPKQEGSSLSHIL